MRAKFGLVPTAVSKILSFKFISRIRLFDFKNVPFMGGQQNNGLRTKHSQYRWQHMPAKIAQIILK